MRRKIIRFAVIGVAVGCVWFSSCRKAQETTEGGEVSKLSSVIATVGTKKITGEDLKQRLNHYKVLLNLEEKEPLPKHENLNKAVLYQLIDEYLLEMEAKRLNISVSNEELEKEVNLLLGKYDNPKLGLILAKNEMSFDEWKASVKKGLVVKKLELVQVESKLSVDESEIKSYYDKNKDSFKWPERVRALQIMVTDETVAEQVRKKLLNKGDFAKIARERSQSPDAASGGDLGYFSRGQMPPEFENAVFGLKVGQISEVIESIYGFHVFKVVNREPPGDMSYDEARGRIRKLLMAQKREKEYKHWIDELKERVPVNIDYEALSRALS